MTNLQGRIVLRDRVVTGNISFGEIISDIEAGNLSNKDPQ